MNTNAGSETSRKGMEGVNYRVIIEFIGALALIIIFGLVIAWFMGTVLDGCNCGGDEECEAACDELQRLVADVNAACQASDEITHETLDDYDFGASHALAIGHTSESLVPDPRSIRQNQFVLTKYTSEDLGLSSLSDLSSADFGDMIDWKIRLTASDCDEVQQCFTNEEMYTERWNCEQGPFTSWIFPIMGGSSGEIRHSSFDSEDAPLVKLRYIGDNSPERWVRDALAGIRDAISDALPDVSLPDPDWPWSDDGSEDDESSNDE